jgi:hypothetical protein
MSASEDSVGRALVRTSIGWTQAMQGQVKEGRQLTVEGLDEAIERGTADWIGVATLACGYAALLEGDVEAAERDFAAAQRTFADQGDRWYLSVANADLALALCSLGRHDEARAACSGPQAPSDAEWVTKWNRVQALLNAASGLLDTAIQHASSMPVASRDGWNSWNDLPAARIVRLAAGCEPVGQRGSVLRGIAAERTLMQAPSRSSWLSPSTGRVMSAWGHGVGGKSHEAAAVTARGRR